MSKDITIEIERAGIGVKDVVRHVQSARGWIDYFFRLATSNTMTHDQATKYDAYKNRLLGSIDDTVSQIDREQNRVPQAYRAPWLNKAIATVALTIAGYTGLAGTLRAEESVAQANKPVIEQKGDTKDGPKKEERDYVKELEEKVKDVKIEEGKDAGWYNNTSARNNTKGQHLQALAYSRKSIEMGHVTFSPYGNAGTAYYGLAEKTMEKSEKEFYLQQSVKAYTTAVEKASKDEFAKESDRKPALWNMYMGLGMSLAKLGNNEEARKAIDTAAKYGALTDQVAKVREQLK